MEKLLRILFASPAHTHTHCSHQLSSRNTLSATNSTSLLVYQTWKSSLYAHTHSPVSGDSTYSALSKREKPLSTKSQPTAVKMPRRYRRIFRDMSVLDARPSLHVIDMILCLFAYFISTLTLFLCQSVHCLIPYQIYMLYPDTCSSSGRIIPYYVLCYIHCVK